MAENGVLYMRRSLKDNDRVLDWSPAAAKSPDIIPYGAGTTGDAQKLFKENYSQDVGRPLIPGEPNHVYVRAKNLGAAPAAGSVRLYQTKSSMLLFPQMWQDGHLKTASGGESSALGATEPGAGSPQTAGNGPIALQESQQEAPAGRGTTFRRRRWCGSRAG